MYLSNQSNTNCRFILGIIIIVTCTIQVYYTTVYKLEHSRNFIRGLNFYVLEHTDFDIYWAGQTLLNYPIHQYLQLNQFSDFLVNMQQFMRNLDAFTYGQINQTQIDNTIQTISFQNINGTISSYQWTIKDGIKQPFDPQNILQMKQQITKNIQFQIPLRTIVLGQHHWNIVFVVEIFSSSSIYVQILATQDIFLFWEHLFTFFLGAAMIGLLIWQFNFNMKLQNMPDYLLGSLLMFGAMLTAAGVGCYLVLIVDGLTCLIAWLWILKVFTKQGDYHISFLIRKSYLLVGRLFISFGPLFIAFGLMGYTCFCRYSGQFRSLYRTLISLFYICYYNMTYQQFIVTSRANPISMIFFFSFVIIFTMCVYSAMLVSVFCSYVWNKRQQKIKKQIVNNLNIQCSSCNHKYKYTDRLQVKSQASPIKQLSQMFQYNLNASQDIYKYTQDLSLQMMKYTNATKKMLENIRQQYQNLQYSINISNLTRQQYWYIKRKIKKILKQHQKIIL